MKKKETKRAKLTFDDVIDILVVIAIAGTVVGLVYLFLIGMELT